MKWIAVIVSVLCVNSVFSQNWKNDISVVQFSADFVKEAELDMKPFKEYHTYTFYMEQKPDAFKSENIKFVPTLVIYQNGKEIMRVESGIDLKLPENTKKDMNKKLNELLENKF